jgi:anti-sigma factor RsiW
MVDYNTPVTDGELHAYVDGELPPDRSEAVEAWLASHPEDAGRVAAWRAQAEAIRARYGTTGHGPVPDRLTLSRITRSQRSWGAVAAAAAVVAFVIGGGAQALHR